jgi:hypothetical protein
VVEACTNSGDTVPKHETSGGRLPPLGRHVDVDGHQLWIHRSGTGGPAVVFLPGAGGMGLDYLLAHDRIAEFIVNVQALLDELRAGGPVPDVPLIVLSGTAIGAEQTMFQSEDNLREQIAGSQRLFEAIAAATPHGEYRVLADASHVTIPMVRSDAVADAARDLLSRLRATRT